VKVEASAKQAKLAAGERYLRIAAHGSVPADPMYVKGGNKVIVFEKGEEKR